jgi:hypothetical protein
VTLKNQQIETFKKPSKGAISTYSKFLNLYKSHSVQDSNLFKKKNIFGVISVAIAIITGECWGSDNV